MKLDLTLSTVCVAFAAPVTAFAQDGEGILTVGPSGGSCWYCGGDEVPIQQGINKLLETGGGELRLLAGTYVFNNTVTISEAEFPEKGITIVGCLGTVLKGRNSTPELTGPLFRVEDHRVRFEGITFDELDPIPGRTTLLEITGRHVDVEDCQFLLGHAATNDATLCPVIHVGASYFFEDPDPVNEPNFGPVAFGDAVIKGNTFTFTASGPGSWRHHVGVLAQVGRNLRVIDNIFQGAYTTVGEEEVQVAGDLHACIKVDEVEVASITRNVFRKLYTDGHLDDEAQMPPPLEEQAAIMILGGLVLGGREGHHTSLGTNTFQDIRAKRCMDFVGTGFQSVSGNVFVNGRGAIRMKDSQNSDVSGNLFDDMGPDATNNIRTVVCLASEGIELSGNLFTNCEKGQMSIRRPCLYLQIHDSLFRKNGTSTNAHPIYVEPAQPPITSSNIYIWGNTFIGGWPQSLSTPGVFGSPPITNEGDNWGS